MSRRTKIILAVVALVVVAGVAGFFVVGQGGSGPEIETASARTQQLAVTVTASGKVESGVSADVFPPVAGSLESIFVDDGDAVEAGQQIAMMDTVPLELQVEQAQAGYAQAKAGLENVGAQGGSKDVTAAKKAVAAAKAGVTAAQSGVVAAEAGVVAAQAAYQNASDAYDAAQLVLPSGSPTLTALATAEKQAYAGYKQSQSGLSSARAGLSSAKSGQAAAEAGLAKAQAADPAASKRAAQAAVNQAAAGLSAARKALDDAMLVAPIDGVVLFNSAGGALGGGGKPTEGSGVSPQAAPFTVVDLGALKFTAEVDEADVSRIKSGMKASVTLDSFAGDEFATQVLRINPAAQPTATGGTVFAVELGLTNTDKAVLIGMKGDATIEVSSQGSALTIPVEALFSEGGTDYVYVVETDTLKKVEITVGATTDTEVEVIKGLSEGDVVALSGATQYTDGMTVRTK